MQGGRFWIIAVVLLLVVSLLVYLLLVRSDSETAVPTTIVPVLQVEVTSRPPATPESSPVVVTLDGAPLELRPVSVGEIVTWRNQNAHPVVIASNDGSFSSGVIAPGAEWSQEFDLPGVYTVTVSAPGGGQEQTGIVEVTP